MDFEKFAEAANRIDGAIRDNASLKSLIVEASSTAMGDTLGQTSKSVQEFLDAPLGDKKEMVMKKALAAAMIMAKERGILLDLPDTGAAIAATVDEGLTRIKTNYQVGTLELDPCDAIDAIIDHIQSRAIAFVDTALRSDEVHEAVSEGLVKLLHLVPEIGPIIGPMARQYKPVIKAVIKRVAEPVRNVITSGINAVSEYAKSAVRKVKETIVEYGKAWAKKLFHS